jgi:hypothetical protein
LPDDGAPEPDITDLQLSADSPQHGHSKAVCLCAQAAKLLAEQSRQHVQPPVNQVHCRASGGGLSIQKAALLMSHARMVIDG